MKLQNYCRAETLSVHNFDCCQIYVGTLTDLRGEVFKGITVEWVGSGSIEAHLPLKPADALKFVEFLDSVIKGNVPNKHTVKPYNRMMLNYVLALHLKFKKVENGFVSCRISFVQHTMWGHVKLSSLNSCVSNIRKLYEFA